MNRNSNNKASRIPRRAFLKGAMASTIAASGGSADAAAAAAPGDGSTPAAPPLRSDAASPPAPPVPVKPHVPETIAKENSKEGSLDWQLTRVRLDGSGIRSPWIEGYCSQQSVEPGQALDIMVSTAPARAFTIEIFRMGYYGGRGARLMTTLGPIKGSPQAVPDIGRKRLRECQWKPSAQLTIPADWPSGVYLGRLNLVAASESEAPWQSYVIFIVREPVAALKERPAGVLFQCSDNTWQAYNRWPDKFSLYDNDQKEWMLASGVDVSFDRPYGKYRQIYDNPMSIGSGEFLLWEFPMVYWLEQQGYDVTYCSNSDMVAPDLGLRHKTFISIGHDEYWDVRQYHSVRQMIDGGVSALFLSGNSVCFVAPFQPSAAGRAHRIITRAGRFGGLSEAEKKIMGPFDTDGPNEGLLMGARTITPFNGGGDWIATRPEHWLFEGTGMKKGDRIPGLVGWEFHGEPADIKGLEVVAEGIALSGGVTPAHWTATVYPGPTAGKANFVFNAATIWWAQGLSSPPGHMPVWSHWTRPHGPDLRVQRITANALKRALR